MVIKNRLFPYPVLAEDIDDYREGSFEVKASVIGDSANDIDLKFHIELDNPGIKKYINSGKAEYVIHIECSLTSYRDQIRFSADEVAYHLPKSEINGYVNLLGMIIAKEDIPFFSNVALDRDYDETDIYMKKGSILAYYNLPRLNIYKHYEELSASENIFVLCRHERRSANEHNVVSFDINSDKIKIFVDDDIYESYVKMQGRTEMKPLFLSSLVYPAMIYMLETLRFDENVIDDCQDKIWYKLINDYYKKEKTSLREVAIDSTDSITKIAQELLNKPINALYSNMFSVLEGNL